MAKAARSMRARRDLAEASTIFWGHLSFALPAQLAIKVSSTVERR